MDTKNDINCPSCGRSGKKVQTKTVKSLIKVTLRKISPEKTYFFCATSGCPVVYYNTSEEVFETSEITVPVFQKESDNLDVPVCYCFGHTVREIKEKTGKGEKEDIIKDINEGIRMKQCACDIRNPQGSCCLGNVKETVKRFLKMYR